MPKLTEYSSVYMYEILLGLAMKPATSSAHELLFYEIVNIIRILFVKIMTNITTAAWESISQITFFECINFIYKL